MNEEIFFTVKNIEKKYGENTVLQNINMNINRGEIVGLIGENGAGKSTLQKIIAGVEMPESGTMEMNGNPYSVLNTVHANNLGVGMVFQEQSLIKNLTVSQNIYLGRESRYSKLGFINWNAMNNDARKVLSSIGINNIQVEKKIIDLDFATRQMVEIAKVIDITGGTSGSSSLVLMDEPTSVLSDSDIEQLFSELRKVSKSGNSVLFVSHRLNEILSLCDSIYVLKDGANVGFFKKEEADEGILYDKMVGRATSGTYYKTDLQVIPEEEVILSVKNLGQLGSFKNVTFDLHKGEILGICGVVGSGKEKLCAVLSGDEIAEHGDIYVKGSVKKFASPYEALKCGILSVPKERRDEGIVGILDVMGNICMSNYDLVKENGFISSAKQREMALKWVSELDIKCSDINEYAELLSGGNAQKVVFARVISSDADIIILNHPTRGVDVGAKEELYTLIRKLSSNGIAVILLGDTLDESIGISSRIIVMKDGLCQKEYDASVDQKPTQVDIVKYML